MSAFLQNPTTHHTKSPQLTSHLPEVLVTDRRHYLCEWANYIVVIKGKKANTKITGIRTTSGGASRVLIAQKGKLYVAPVRRGQNGDNRALQAAMEGVTDLGSSSQHPDSY